MNEELKEQIEKNQNLINALEDRQENAGKHYKLKIYFWHEEKVNLLYFNCLDLFETKELITIFALNYKIDEIKIKEY